MDNPLASTTAQATAARLARLYVLTRDAYLSAPVVTAGKLAALDELRQVESSSAQHTLEGCERQVEVGQVRGVRLVELLRVAMHDLSNRLDADARALALLDALHATTPPSGFGWATSPVYLTSEAAAYIAPELSSQQIHRIAKAHRASRRLLTTGVRLGLPARALLEDPTAPEVAVADMLGEVLGLGPAPARCAAIVLIDGGSLETARGLAGGMIFDPLYGFNSTDAFVGTALARTHPTALIHEFAGVECAVKLCPSIRPTIAAALEALREDLVAGQGRSSAEYLRLRAARRAVDLAILRMGAGDRGPLRLASRRHLPRPGFVTPTAG